MVLCFAHAYLEDGDKRPEESIEVAAVARHAGLAVAKLAAEEAHAEHAEDEDKKQEKDEEGGHVLHRAQQHEKLAPKCRHEAHKFEHAQQTECAKNRKPGRPTLQSALSELC